MKELVVSVKKTIGIPKEIISYINKNIDEVVKNETYFDFICEVNNKLEEYGSQECVLDNVWLEGNTIITVWSWYEECPFVFEVHFDRTKANKVVKIDGYLK